MIPNNWTSWARGLNVVHWQTSGRAGLRKGDLTLTRMKTGTLLQSPAVSRNQGLN